MDFVPTFIRYKWIMPHLSETLLQSENFLNPVSCQCWIRNLQFSALVNNITFHVLPHRVCSLQEIIKALNFSVFSN